MLFDRLADLPVTIEAIDLASAVADTGRVRILDLKGSTRTPTSTGRPTPNSIGCWSSSSRTPSWRTRR
jgi:hypothetical protein